MVVKAKNEPQNPLIIRCHRLMDAFAKSNDERDFFLDRTEGFILYVDLDKSDADIENLEKELEKNRDRYVMLPKLTFYETKKIMEGFVNEKVYDIDTKEKLLDIIQSKEARENFLEFIYDHHSEYEKWQQFYQERSRIRIIEWLRQNNFYFVFEEDLELSRKVIEGLKRNLFQSKVPKDIIAARKALVSKAKTYYSNEALNPRPKRGRPPKQAIKAEIEPQITSDIYTTVPATALSFLYTPDITSVSAITFSDKFESEEDLLSNRKLGAKNDGEISIDSFNEKLAALRSLSTRWLPQAPQLKNTLVVDEDEAFDDEDEDEEDDDSYIAPSRKKASAPTPKPKSKLTAAAKAKTKGTVKAATKKQTLVATKAKPTAKPMAKPAAKKPTTRK